MLALLSRPQSPDAKAQDAPPPCLSWAPIAVLGTDTAPGIDAAVASMVEEQLRRTAAATGYLPLPGETLRSAALRAGIAARDGVPPAPEDVLRLTREVKAQRGLFANVSASAGTYVAYLFIANGDGTPPFFAQGNATAENLLLTVDALLRSILPAPMPTGCALPSSAPPASPPRTAEGGSDARTLEQFRRLRLAVQTESAFGLTETFFYNHLAGARVDYRFTPRVALGGYLGYANLRGKDGRASNVLPYFQLEYRQPLGHEGPLALPLRFASGYLPRNGPVVRLSAGASYAIGESVTLELDLLAPTFWVTHNETIVSLDFAAEIAWAL